MDKRFATILAILVLVFVGIFAVSKNSSNKSNGSNPGGPQPTNHIQGEGKAGVTLVEYGDYECPVCEIYYQPVKQVVAQFNSDIRFQFRNLPLSSVHRNAFAAARAAEAASYQNKYWEMHDALYENQSSWAASTAPQTLFTDYARQLGLNVDQFKKDYQSQKVNDAINADLEAFNQTGQQMSTPSFFLNGRYLPNGLIADQKTGQPSIEKLTAVIKAEINKKNSGAKQ